MLISSVDTAAFYSDAENDIETEIVALRIERSKLKEELQAVQEYHAGQCTYDKTLAKLNRIHDIEIYVVPDKDDIAELYSQISEINKSLTQLKEKLKTVFSGTSPHRILRSEAVNDRTTIAVFESFLTRTLGLKIDEYSDALIVVRVYFYEIFRDLVLNGFDYNGSHYVVLTASAGQIRTKKCVFIKEDLLQKHSNTIMCGLTVDHINECGGCNTNKYLAYLALANSATEEWKEFDIDRCIVVDDMETLVRGMVDYIDDKTYSITRQEMDIPINHTDGCGMVLPRLTGGKNTMFRMPWVKGLLASFAFDDFVHEANFDGGWNFGIIKDIYGKPHDVIAENIEVILTRSQFKMAKYYSDWDHYKRCYKQYGCSAGLCNFEEDRIDNASIGYQMLQSLVDLTDDELTKLSAQTRYKLEHISSDRKVMLKCLGATPGNPNKDSAQECLLLYPELLQDEYYREELRNMRASIEKWAWAGKLDIFAKYLFLIPDLFAFCEFLFLGNKNPTGLLANGEVYAAQFPSAEKLDCLRSPSLYREHPVRINKVNDEKCFRWFSERGLYTSCHDLISKVIQNDFDGDCSLACAEKTLVDAAERHMQDIVPLYYEMRKAKAQQISMQSIYDGMAAAYSGGNIGPISNSISKIWNSENPDLDTIKRLCYRNNEVIDFAKTLYKSIAPKDISKQLSTATNQLLPHFFIYAKDKNKSQVNPPNNSPVNRLKKIIPHFKFNFRKNKFGKFDFHMLMNNPSLIHTNHVDELIREYTRLAGNINTNDNENEDNNYLPQYLKLRNKLFAMATNNKYVVDAIIYGIFYLRKSKHKKAFWGAFGDIVLENLKLNLSKQCDDMILCRRCYTRFIPEDERQLCPHCGAKNANVKYAPCVDCGEDFVVSTRSVRCPRCQKAADIENGRARIEKFRNL